MNFAILLLAWQRRQNHQTRIDMLTNGGESAPALTEQDHRNDAHRERVHFATPHEPNEVLRLLSTTNAFIYGNGSPTTTAAESAAVFQREGLL